MIILHASWNKPEVKRNILAAVQKATHAAEYHCGNGKQRTMSNSHSAINSGKIQAALILIKQVPLCHFKEFQGSMYLKIRNGQLKEF